MRKAWRWAALALLALGFLQLGAPPARADDPVECRLLMPLDPAYRNLNPEVLEGNCVERGRFTVRGHQILVTDLEGYSPPNERARMALVREAVESSFDYYSRWFSLFDIMFVFGDLPSTYDAETGMSEELADAVGDRFACVISVEAGALHTGRGGSDAQDVKRTIAHELFHCVQSTDPVLRLQYFQKWRDESTAEYFGALVVPRAPYNGSYGQELERIRTTPLYQLDEDAAPFIFYFGNLRGPDAVVSWMRSADPGRDAAAQIATLQNIPDIDRVFHTFIRSWLDAALYDTAGGLIPATTPTILVDPINSERELDLGEAPSFTAQIAGYELEQEMAWRFEVPEDGVTGSWQNRPSDWQDFPATIDACDSRKSSVIVLTSTAATTSPVRYRTRITEHPEEMRACPCPLGTWTMDTAALRTSSPTGTMVPGELTAGRVTLMFLRNGTARGFIETLRFDTDIDRTSSMRTTFHGNIEWTWRQRPSEIRSSPAAGPSAGGGGAAERLRLERTIVRAEGSSTVTFLSRGAPTGPVRTTPWRPGQAGGSMSVHEAYCDAEGLHILPNPQVGASGAPWHGLYRRGG